MKKLIASIILGVMATTGTIIATPAPVAAQSTACMETCDEDFDGGWQEIAIRGWCYIIRCMIMPD